VYVIENPDLAVPQSGQRAAVRSVFKELLKASSERRYFLFPSGFQSTISTATNKRERVRIVADCVSGMTEKELLHFHRCLSGHN
jgi:dGTP triphosphohydrolase